MMMREQRLSLILAAVAIISFLHGGRSFNIFSRFVKKQVINGAEKRHSPFRLGMTSVPTSAESTHNFKGFDKFLRVNPLSDKFNSRRFHHIEFYTGEASAVYTRFMLSLGMNLIAKSDLSSGNSLYASYLLESGDVKMLFTTPYPITNGTYTDHSINPSFSTDVANHFIVKHGLGVRAIAIEVDDVSNAFNAMLSNGGRAVLPPTRVDDKEKRGYADVAEIALYGDAVIRLINTDNFHGTFFPNYNEEKGKYRDYGIRRFDHIVGNVWNLSSQAAYMKNMTGFHEFAEFVADDVGTVDSGLNSVVLANNNEYVLLPINEPTYGTKRKSQIQTYLEQNLGEGVQHIALFTKDIFETLRQMKAAADYGVGFSFMAPPPMSYYDKVKERIQPFPLTEEQLSFAKDIGLLIDRDDQGVLLQIFTKPVGDRPTVFLELIQRIGCEDKETKVQKPGCGGFGKGNFRDLFKSIEEYEKTLGIN